MSGTGSRPTDRAEAAARWLLSLPAGDSAAVVERLSRETLEEIRAALRRLGELPDLASGSAGHRPAADALPAASQENIDIEPPFLLAALVAATPAAGRDAVRAAIAARRGPDVLAAIDGFGILSPVPEARRAMHGATGGSA